MKRFAARCSFQGVAIIVLLLTGLYVRADRSRVRAADFRPESEEVRACVAKAVKFLETNEDPWGRVGAKALVALALIKAGEEANHPKVRQALQAMRTDSTHTGDTEDIYTTAVKILLLVALDPAEHHATISSLIKSLVERQKSGGGWGYPNQPTGDTSMTQYGVLALWEAARAGFDVPIAVWERVTLWLLRTQDPSGAFGYQGREPPEGETGRVTQQEVRHSLAAAGMGSLYICGMYLRIRMGADEAEAGPPALLTPVASRSPSGGAASRSTARVDTGRYQEAQALGNRWLREHYEIKPSDSLFLYYYLYALERYESFREAASGRFLASPRWYQDGARMLIETQDQDGGWNSMQLSGNVCDTAFAILFLVRSTRQSLSGAGHLGGGTLRGGRGLPSDAGGEVEIRLGKLRAKPLAGPAEALLAMLDDPTHPDHLRAIEGAGDALLEVDEATVSKYEAHLRQLAGSDDPDARIAAVRALGRQRELDNVPTLIFALTDPDMRVVHEASDALRFVSRKFRALGAEPLESPVARKTAIERWKTWYRSIRPDADLAD